eukprot:SAG31_NODE_352_length_17229_cov_9.658669_9_plen_71_part_00
MSEQSEARPDGHSEGGAPPGRLHPVAHLMRDASRTHGRTQAVHNAKQQARRFVSFLMAASTEPDYICRAP